MEIENDQTELVKQVRIGMVMDCCETTKIMLYNISVLFHLSFLNFF